VAKNNVQRMIPIETSSLREGTTKQSFMPGTPAIKIALPISRYKLSNEKLASQMTKYLDKKAADLTRICGNYYSIMVYTQP